MEPRFSLPWRSSRLELWVESLSGTASWQMKPEEQTWIFHLGGKLHGLNTETGDGLSCGDVPLPGEIWRIGAGEIYRGVARGSSMAYLLLRLSPKNLKALGGVGEFQTSSRFCYRDPEIAASLFELRAQTSRIGLEATCGRLMWSLGQHLRTEARILESPKLHGSTVKHLEQFIEGHLSEPIRLEQLCRESGLSRSELCRRFSATFGISPGQYILRRRVRRAASLLAEGPVDLSGLAFDVGFSSHSHLTHAFRGLTGLTPSRYLDARTLGPVKK